MTKTEDIRKSIAKREDEAGVRSSSRRHVATSWFDPPLVIPILMAGLIAGVALVAMVLKLAPVLALALVLYWIVTRQRRTLRSGR